MHLVFYGNTMNLDLLLIGVIVAASALYIVRTAFGFFRSSTRKNGSSCSNCRCAEKAS